MDVEVTLLFNGSGSADPTEAMIQTGRDAPRAFPLENIIKNLIVTINGCNIDVNLSQIVAPFSRYYMDTKKLNAGITPNMLDNLQDMLMVGKC